MNLVTYLQTWRGTHAENKAMRPILLILAVANLALVFFLFQQSRTIVVVPPGLTGEAAISQDEASPEIQQEWGLYLTTLTGNMTPRTAPLIKEVLGKHLAPNVFNQVNEWIDTEMAVITRDKVTLSFSPTVLRYEPKIDKVVVTGDMVLRGLRGQERRQVRTYELGFRTSNYRVQLTSFSVYEGGFNRRGQVEE